MGGGGGGGVGGGGGGGGGVGGHAPPIICTNMLYCSLQRSVILKKFMCAPPICKKIYVCPPICNCFLRACVVTGIDSNNFMYFL